MVTLAVLALIGLLVQVFWILSASAELAGRLAGMPKGSDYQAWYDDELDLTWLVVDRAVLAALGASPDGEVDWPTLARHLEFLEVAGRAGWRLPVLDVNLDGVVEDCAGLHASACTDNELQHLYLSILATEESGGADGASDALKHAVPPGYYWTAGPCRSNHECRLAFGMFGPRSLAVQSHVANTHRVIVVQRGDVFGDGN
jgi:hypothetical protein